MFRIKIVNDIKKYIMCVSVKAILLRENKKEVILQTRKNKDVIIKYDSVVWGVEGFFCIIWTEMEIDL
jgi:hypothetical protein